ncbi:hypothetical protein GCM10022206_78250 [Streptomyces chiangmaiensis]
MDLLGQVGGMPRDCGQRGGACEYGDRAQGEQGAELVAAALAAAGIRQSVQDVGQAVRRTRRAPTTPPRRLSGAGSRATA